MRPRRGGEPHDLLDEIGGGSSLGELLEQAREDGEDEVREGHPDAHGCEEGDDEGRAGVEGGGDECAGDEAEAREAEDRGHDAEDRRKPQAVSALGLTM